MARRKEDKRKIQVMVPTELEAWLDVEAKRYGLSTPMTMVMLLSGLREQQELVKDGQAGKEE